MKRTANAFLACASLAVSMAFGAGRIPLRALVLLDSDRPESRQGRERVIPHLDHFGIPYAIRDVAPGFSLPDSAAEALIVVPHAGILAGRPSGRASLESAVETAVRAGAGLITFDPFFLNPSHAAPGDTAEVSVLRFTEAAHFITEFRVAGDSIRLFGPARMPATAIASGDILIRASGFPFLAAERLGKGRIVRWAGTEWMHSSVLGSMGGLDGCVWRSAAWAARKPFVMRGLPPVVAMRVDDVAGRGEIWGRSPLYWIETANRHGFKPWLGLFIYNLDPRAVDELRHYLVSGLATASPHALGRPNRRNPEKQAEAYLASGQPDDFPFHYDPGALPLRVESYDEFIYFDHHRGRPWPDEEAERGLRAVDEWLAARAPLPLSNYFVPHWYEFGANVIAHVARKWGMRFVAAPKPLEAPYDESVPWLRGGPFRIHETPQSSRITRPVYYADTVTFAGERFFNCLTEIRDDAGYEWAPDNDVPATIGRGVRQLGRAFDAMALPVLFTHETDYIYRITPENWDAALRGIAEGIRSRDPVFVTMDRALETVRATKTSGLASAGWIPSENAVEIVLSGDAEVETCLVLFTDRDGGVDVRRIPVPYFRGGFTLRVTP